MSKLELSKQTPLLLDIFELALGCWSNIVGCEPFMTVSIHTSPVFRESPKPGATSDHETSARKYSEQASMCAGVVQSVENILTNCFSIRVQAATQKSAALTLPADTQVVTRQSRGGHWTTKWSPKWSPGSQGVDSALQQVSSQQTVNGGQVNRGQSGS